MIYDKEEKKYLIVPNTLDNRPSGWNHADDRLNITILSDREFHLIDENTMVFEDINDATQLDITAYEEEEIPYNKLDVAIDIIQKYMDECKNPDLEYALQKLFEAAKLAKAKKTLLALYL